MVESQGELDLRYDADDANIPVSVFIYAPQDTDNSYDELWLLKADNYMPRKGRCAEGAYEMTADTEGELRELVKKYILPLYTVAYQRISEMAVGGCSKLYYWE